jgi:hypothetical protein
MMSEFSISKILHWINQTRRNHALEHATLTLLAKKFPRTRMMGYSDMNGFWLLGDLQTDDVAQAASEALERLRNGQKSLAIHPNCGTNFATTGILAGSAAWLALLGTDDRVSSKFDRWPLAVAFATVAVILSRTLGPKMQAKVTTLADPGNMQITEIRRSDHHNPAHRIKTL